MSKDKATTGRRSLLKLAATGTVAWPGVTTLIASSAALGRQQDALPHLREDDPQARELSYTHDAESAESRSNDSAYCHNCRFFADSSAQWAGCDLFPGKAVNADGWCNSWVGSQ
ncbi:MAG: high-potential iron-sulfur protein [Gammaproteobacteria bacterium]|nr:high-potential iron-sulfur protein [Pseudomonadales bacterium]MCP5348614.1 high-potential iron-sulfur protein [Pseudomonadales bacterium]